MSEYVAGLLTGAATTILGLVVWSILRNRVYTINLLDEDELIEEAVRGELEEVQ